jgi:hypothetical protein
LFFANFGKEPTANAVLGCMHQAMSNMLCTMDLQTIDFTMLDKPWMTSLWLIVLQCMLDIFHKSYVYTIGFLVEICFFEQFMWKIGINNTNPSNGTNGERERTRKSQSHHTYLTSHIPIL